MILRYIFLTCEFVCKLRNIFNHFHEGNKSCLDIKYVVRVGPGGVHFIHQHIQWFYTKSVVFIVKYKKCSGRQHLFHLYHCLLATSCVVPYLIFSLFSYKFTAVLGRCWKTSCLFYSVPPAAARRREISWGTYWRRLSNMGKVGYLYSSWMWRPSYLVGLRKHNHWKEQLLEKLWNNFLSRA